MSHPFAAEAVTPNLIRVYVGKNVTVWLSYGTPIAFAINGYGTVKLDPEGETTTTRKHLAPIAAKATMPRDEFNARLNVLAYSLDDEATRMIDRPSWSNDEQSVKDGRWIAGRTGWEV